MTIIEFFVFRPIFIMNLIVKSLFYSISGSLTLLSLHEVWYLCLPNELGSFYSILRLPKNRGFSDSFSKCCEKIVIGKIRIKYTEVVRKQYHFITTAVCKKNSWKWRAKLRIKNQNAARAQKEKKKYIKIFRDFSEEKQQTQRYFQELQHQN